MTHPSDEMVVGYCVGDTNPADAARLEAHLAVCAPCRELCAETRRVLEIMARVPVPERDATYGARVWERLEPTLARSETAPDASRGARPSTRLPWHQRSGRTWLVAAALLMAVLGSFFAGRWTARESPGAEWNALAHERILLAMAADHLDRSSRTLVELANADPRGDADLTREQARVRDLLAVNRLLRQSAGAEDAVLQAVLEDLERTLLEIAHASTAPGDNELPALQARLETRSLLFKMRIASAQFRDRALGARRSQRQTI